MESFVRNYFDSFFTPEERKSFITFYYNSIQDFAQDWTTIENEYKKLINVDNFNMVVADNASYFIEKLFNKHVDKDTFVIGSLVHSTVINEMNKVDNKYILSYNDIKTLDINKLISKYKESNCKKLFIYLPSMVEQQLLLQLFCERLKEELVNQNIDHIIVLDDVATMFIIPKDYNIFDYVIFTCHSLIPNFNFGLLFYKSNINIDFGYKDYLAAYCFINYLKKFLSKSDKILIFNIILQQYYTEELSNNIFKLSSFTTPNIFYIMLTDNKLNNIMDKYKEELRVYNIDYDNGIIIIRCSHLLNQDVDNIIKGLEKLKQILQKCIKLKDRL